jgi:hypothetical protein
MYSIAKLMFAIVFCGCLFAQDNYEIQVYGSETVPRGQTQIEFHSNFTISGAKMSHDGVLPDEHATHETIEIIHGFTDWFETGFYVFTSGAPGQGYRWVGDHIRPRIQIPEGWHWPIGVSLSSEIGYQRPIFSEDTWTWDIRPIIDKHFGPWYLAVNPTLVRSLRGPGISKGVVFAPSFKLRYQLTHKLGVGFEYYSSVGPVFDFDPVHEQQEGFFPAIDYKFGRNWELNFGAGIGVTQATDHLIIKMILARRFDFRDLGSRHGSKAGSDSGR